ncbi:sigma-54 interaction domain-containing protein [Pseudomonadota bacterium]
MSQAEVSGTINKNGCVILTGGSPEDNAYLKHVIEFIDYSVKEAADAKVLANCLDELGKACTAVILGASCKADVSAELLQTIAEKEYRPAVFQVGPEKPGKMVVNEDVSIIGNIELPTCHGVLINILHKAEIHNEANCASGEDMRSLELFRSLSGNSRATLKIARMIEQVADSDATVLILGESGTGKEVVARKLHYQSLRRNKPFVPVNCGAIPADLLESELFGHEKGAFTGAISARQGRFEMAEGGTLFLDEIGDMSMPMQVKLLRVLQERSFERVGSNKTIHCDVRIIAATHRDLEKSIKDDLFREDLFYRLNVFPIELSPLRERIEDIPLLATDLISRIENEKRGSVRLTPAAITALGHYSWPGNVRELANLIERLAILFPYGVVDAKDLPEKFRAGVDISQLENELPQVTIADTDENAVRTVARLPSEGIDLKEHLCNLEQELIKQALDEAGGVVAHAAKRLQMRRTTLVEKLRKYGMQRGNESSII